MVGGVGDEGVGRGMMSREDRDQGIRDLYCTVEQDLQGDREEVAGAMSRKSAG